MHDDSSATRSKVAAAAVTGEPVEVRCCWARSAAEAVLAGQHQLTRMSAPRAGEPWWMSPGDNICLLEKTRSLAASPGADRFLLALLARGEPTAAGCCPARSRALALLLGQQRRERHAPQRARLGFCDASRPIRPGMRAALAWHAGCRALANGGHGSLQREMEI
ncbi:hypothetical protein AB3662_06795 [Sorangium cellulosum]|uniref:hypothetical protein n=1 Tax=Sorangium cellulosum TaxID=56 RepID=UPI003D9A352F